jgi:hypothetical protein
MDSLVNKKTLTVAVYMMKTFTTISDLDQTSNDWSAFCEVAQSVIIVLNADPKQQKVGAFKMASFGVATPPIFGTDHNICAKQSYYATQGLRIAGTMAVPTYNVAHDVQRQVRPFSDALNVLTPFRPRS